MSTPRSPMRWAIDISSVLNRVLGTEHFPIKVATFAQEYSHQLFPNDPITLIKGDALSSFDGALFRAPSGAKGWGIIYNGAITSKGRINFTLAHEFGHYLIHRLAHPRGAGRRHRRARRDPRGTDGRQLGGLRVRGPRGRPGHPQEPRGLLRQRAQRAVPRRGAARPARLIRRRAPSRPSPAAPPPGSPATSARRAGRTGAAACPRAPRAARRAAPRRGPAPRGRRSRR